MNETDEIYLQSPEINMEAVAAAVRVNHATIKEVGQHSETLDRAPICFMNDDGGFRPELLPEEKVAVMDMLRSSYRAKMIVDGAKNEKSTIVSDIYEIDVKGMTLWLEETYDINPDTKERAGLKRAQVVTPIAETQVA
jgi:hypothetical protein